MERVKGFFSLCGLFTRCVSRVNPLTQASINTPLFSLDGLVVKAKCVKCYDADTVHLVFPYRGQLARWTCRLLGIDSAEIRTKNTSEHDHAIRARDYLRECILNKTVTAKCGKFDKYGRLLVVIMYNGKNMNLDLVDKGHAYMYDGGRKRGFQEWAVIGAI